MLDQFYYKNNYGEVLSFGSGGIYANYNDLRDYEWSYLMNNNRIVGFQHDPVEKTLPIVFVGKNEKECRTSRNSAFTIVEKDVINGTPGKIYVGEYYLNCYIVASANSDYLRGRGRFLNTAFKIVTDDPVWHRDLIPMEFRVSETSSSAGLDYPYDYPYDYSANAMTSQFLNVYTDFPADFQIVIWGPCENPMITINNHIYGVNDTLNAGEIITITKKGREKSIVKTTVDNQNVSVFNKRYKPHSIFEQLPPGVSPISWNGAFGFTVCVFEIRSEPKWIFEEKEDPEKKTEDIIITSNLLLDSNGDYLLDSNNERIEVAG